jgi:hypothetical protein
MERQSNEQAADAGRTRERARQDAMLEREARRESWLSRLRRYRWFAKGRPEPGNSGADAPETNTDRSRR